MRVRYVLVVTVVAVITTFWVYKNEVDGLISLKQCQAQKRNTRTTQSDPNQAQSHVAQFDVIRTDTNSSNDNISLPDHYCFQDADFSSPTETITVSPTGLLEMYYDSGHRDDDTSYHKIVSRAPHDENSAFYFDVKYEGTKIQLGALLHLSSEVSGGNYHYQIVKSLSGREVQRDSFTSLDALKHSQYNFLISQVGVMNAQTLHKLNEQYLSQ